MKGYMILSADNTADLQQQVEKFVNEGWITAGGLAISKEVGYHLYHQALVGVPGVESGLGLNVAENGKM